MSISIPQLQFSAHESVPILGQGTWNMGDDSARRQEEIAALQLGIDLGLTIIDTAEMYGNGASEELVGQAIKGRRDELFVVSKVLPSHASRQGTIAVCENSLRRLGTEYLDLYLLHWRGSIPLSETVTALEALVSSGKIRHWGVSNFDPDDMRELEHLVGGNNVETNQVLYNLTRRGIEFDLLPYCQQKKIPVMAYSPIEQGRLLDNRALISLAKQHNVTPAQVALAWLLRQDNVISIPKASTAAHVRENRAALDLKLTEADLVALDAAFPPPTRSQPLEML